MRIDKFLVACGIGTRSEVKTFLKKKWVTVDGKVTTSAKEHIDEKVAYVTFQDKPVSYEEFVYYLLNKPKGVLSATEDKDSKTVLDLLDDTARQKKVFPVGRLDKDTTGLLLLTNDGDLAHQLLSPKKHVAKRYQAIVSGVMTSEDAQTFKQGIPLKDFKCQPATLEIIEIDHINSISLVEIIISEGKFHQVKRMVAYCGKEVTELKRLEMGSLRLDGSIAEGDFRRLTVEELKLLKGE